MAKLEHVFGTTACSSSISVEPESGLIAYPAGSTIVIQNPKTKSQAHLISPSKNHLTCLAFSDDSKYIVTGEFGTDPMVRIWEMDNNRQSNGQQLAELKYHKLGITCVRFLRDSVISVGNQHDKSIVVWNWKAKKKITENRLTSQVNAMAINKTKTTCVTVGVRHVKFWYTQEEKGAQMVLQGRSAILGDQRDNTFVDVCYIGDNRTLSITLSRRVIEFTDKKLSGIFSAGDEIPFSITPLPDGNFFMGFNNGIIRLINKESRKAEFELCKPHPLLVTDPNTYDGYSNADNTQSKFPDVHSLVYHAKTGILTALYSNRSIYHWHITIDPGRPEIVNRVSSQLFHVGPVFDLEITKSTAISSNVLFTSGADETIRIWTLDEPPKSVLHTHSQNSFHDLSKILYISQSVDALTEQPDKNFGVVPSDVLDSTKGIRCLRLGFGGCHLACGGRNGNIYIFDLANQPIQKLREIDAHDNEILCLEYSENYNNDAFHLLASGSRDRLIHLFNAKQDYTYLATIEDHSSTISCIKFLPPYQESRFDFVTLATDKLIVIRESYVGQEIQINRVGQIVSQVNPNCFDVTNENEIIAGCQDRQIRTFGTLRYAELNAATNFSYSCKPMRTFKGTQCEEGTLTKICLDPSETYAATVCSDRYVYIVDIAKGVCIAALTGQSDCVSSIRFSPDCRRLVIVSYSGCIFVWRLAKSLTMNMLKKMQKDNARSSSPDSLIESGSDTTSAVSAAVVQRINGENSKLEFGSQFGSLASVNIAAGGLDDDLDSGIDGERHRNFLLHDDRAISKAEEELNENPEKRGFQLQPIETRSRTQPDVANQQEFFSSQTTCNFPTSAEFDTVEMNQTPGASYYRKASPNRPYLLQNQFTPSGIPPSSKSMSNLSHNLHNQSGMVMQQPRQRRRWNLPAKKESGEDIPDFFPGDSSPILEESNLQTQTQSSFIVPSASNYKYFPYQEPTQQTKPTTMMYNLGIPSSSSLSSLQMTGLSFHPQNQSSTILNNGICPSRKLPDNTMFAGFSTNPQTPLTSSFHSSFSAPYNELYSGGCLQDKNIMERNSLSRKFIQTEQENAKKDATVWTPTSKEITKRRPSNLFEKLEESHSNFDSKSNISEQKDFENSSGIPPSLRSRSQSPSYLAMKYFAETTANSTRTTTPAFKKNLNDDNASIKTAGGGYRRRQVSSLSSAKATSARNRSNSNINIRLSSLADTSQTRLDDARERLRKSKENLSIMEHDGEGFFTEDSSLARSTSIGNLKLSTGFDYAEESSHNNTFPDFDEPKLRKNYNATSYPLSEQKRYMAKSVTNLSTLNSNKTTSGVITHPDDCNLQKQYATGISQLSASRQRLEEMVRGIKKMSVTDLTSELSELGQNFASKQKTSGIGSKNYFGANSVDAHSNTYYPTTNIVKNLKRGVQKKLDSQRHQSINKVGTDMNLRDGSEQTTTSGESDSNSPELGLNALGMRRFVVKPKSGLLSTPNQTNYLRPQSGSSSRSISSFGPSPAKQALSIAHRPSNYLVHKLGNPDSALAETRTSWSPEVYYQRNHSRLTGPSKTNLSPNHSSSSIELANAIDKISRMSSDGSKRIAKHASECIEEMTKACDKLIHAQQLITKEKSIPEDERRQLLAGVHEALDIFRQRLDNVLVAATSFEASDGKDAKNL